MSRRIYRWDKEAKCLVECGEEVHADTRQPVFTDRYMEGVRATDGTDIGSRQKRRMYMKANDLADYDDFKGVREKARAYRDAYYSGQVRHKETREAVARAWHDIENRKGRK